MKKKRIAKGEVKAILSVDRSLRGLLMIMEWIVGLICGYFRILVCFWFMF